MGTRKSFQRKVAIIDNGGHSRSISTAPENCAVVLLVQPAQKFLQARVGKDLLNGIESVSQFIMRPGVVNKIFARVTCRDGFYPSLAARDHVMLPSGHFAITECALFSHSRLHTL